MFKITEVRGSHAARRLKLEGKFLSPWIDALLAACDGQTNAPGRLELDLAGVSFVDGSSLIVLRDLIRRGASVARSSPFISELLNEERNP
jgi:hypothetical protein